MKPKEIFSLAVRVLGLVFLYQGLTAVPTQIPLLNAARSLGQLTFFLFLTAWPLLIAWWLLRGAPLLLRVAYPGVGHSRDEQQVPGACGSKAQP